MRSAVREHTSAARKQVALAEGSALAESHRTRYPIVQGPMTDVEGILVRTKPGKGLLVLSVALLHGSVAVEVDCTLAIPV